MSARSARLAKSPELPTALDFSALREAALEDLGRLAGHDWTDYNTHDPGITLLEALLHTLTDLSYRARWRPADLLAQAEHQAFFSARDALTNNPLTPDDYRRLWIDQEGVRNAWVRCLEPCSALGGAPVRGLYEAQIELESDEELGDLNDPMLVERLFVGPADARREVLVEVRFPELGIEAGAPDEVLAALENVAELSCLRLQRVRAREFPELTHATDEELRRGLRRPFFATLRLVSDSGRVLVLEDVSVRALASGEAAAQLGSQDLVDLLEEPGEQGLIAQHAQRLRLVRGALEAARARFHQHRNLDEDLGRLELVRIAHIGFCADVDLEPDADPELVQARIWHAFERHLNPPIPVRSLAEMRRLGLPVEEIFSGPALEHGFLLQADLDASQPPGAIRGSDLIDLVMEIEGVRSIANLLMTRYDAQGNPVAGASDPTPGGQGSAAYDPARTSAAWILALESGQHPRLYHNLSHFRFVKGGLPVALDASEASETLVQLRGEAERPQQSAGNNDLEPPEGRQRDAAAITPVQHLLPRTFGVGPDGLPQNASGERRAHALQLKAYLMVYEQLLGNAFQQVARFPDLFSTRPDLEATAFPHDFSDQIAQHALLLPELDAAQLQRLSESRSAFLERRNAFLDHLLARFGLSVDEYALLLSNWKGERRAHEELIADKLALLAASSEVSEGGAKRYGDISGGRARAFDRGGPQALAPGNEAILKRRCLLLLGYAELHLRWTLEQPAPGLVRTQSFAIEDARGALWGSGELVLEQPSVEAAERAGRLHVLRLLSQVEQYVLVETAAGPRLVARDAQDDAAVPHCRVEFARELSDTSSARELRDELVATASMARALVVEHLLLRPKFPGDALLAGCEPCADADPWSFRLTLVLPGWSAPYSDDLDWRDFATATVQEEVPAHLLPKVCWVGDRRPHTDDCDPQVDALRRLIQEGVRSAEGEPPTCEAALECALLTYRAHASAFEEWYAAASVLESGAEASAQSLRALFEGVGPADLACALDLAPVWDALRERLLHHFQDLVRHGYAFRRFETAWGAWLEADAAFDWSSETLVGPLRALLELRLRSGPVDALCELAEASVRACGEAFAQWRDEQRALGRGVEQFDPFEAPDADLGDAHEFSVDTSQEVSAFLEQRYRSYAEVSTRLAVLVEQLAALTNTYPATTLHDCDGDGGENPLRLNQTALGSLSSISTAEVELVVEPEPTPRRARKKRSRKRKR